MPVLNQLYTTRLTRSFNVKWPQIFGAINLATLTVFIHCKIKFYLTHMANKNFLVNKIILISSYIHFWSSRFLLATRKSHYIRRNLYYIIIKNFLNLWSPFTLPEVKNVWDEHPIKLNGHGTNNFEQLTDKLAVSVSKLLVWRPFN